MGPQTLIWAVAVVVARCGPPAGKPSRALVFRSRCRSRSVSTRRRGRPAPTAARGAAGRSAGRGGARPAQMASRVAAVSSAGRLAVAAPDLAEVMTARRAAVNEISRGWTTWPARLPLRAGTATAAAARAVAGTSSAAVTQAACSWATRAGEPERSIGPVDGPAPLIADLDSFRQVSDPIHRQ